MARAPIHNLHLLASRFSSSALSVETLLLTVPEECPDKVVVALRLLVRRLRSR
jgi:hypothetical protein